MIDTHNKRSSAIMVSLPYRGMLPLPDGVVDVGDRVQTAFYYRGIIQPVPPGSGGPDIVGVHPSGSCHGSRSLVGVRM